MSTLATSFATVTGIWTVVVLTPGPNFLATAQSSLARSRRAGLLVVAGIAAGTAIWGIASLFGLGLLFQAAGDLYRIVRWAGAAYLIYVGARLLLSARSASNIRIGAGPGLEGVRAFRHGLVTDLSNPKAAVFFTSLFAVTVPPTAPIWFDAALVGVVTAIAALWYSLVACALTVAPVVVLYRRLSLAIAAVAGLIFIGLGVRLATER